MPPCSRVPAPRHGRVEQRHRAGQQPRGRPVALEDQEELGPLRQVTGLVSPGPEDVRAVVAVVLPVDGPVGVVVLPDEVARERRLPHRDVAGEGLGAIEEARVPRRLPGGEHGLAGVHVGVLSPIGIEDRPVGARLVGVQPGARLPEPVVEQRDRLVEMGARLHHAGHERMGVRQDDEREAVAVIGGVDRRRRRRAPRTAPRRSPRSAGRDAPRAGRRRRARARRASATRRGAATPWRSSRRSGCWRPGGACARRTRCRRPGRSGRSRHRDRCSADGRRRASAGRDPRGTSGCGSPACS